VTLLDVRRRQVPVLAARLPTVSTWQPAAAVAVIGLVVIISTPSVGGDPLMRLRLSAIGMAAALAFVLDDRAAVTLAPSPLTLLERRALRVGVVIPIVAAWWASLLVLLSVRSSQPVPATSMVLLELVMYSAIGLAGAVWSQRRSDDGSGGVAGAVLVTVLFLSASLRMPEWWPLARTSSGMVPARLQLVLATAVVALVAGSLDPAGRRPRTRSRPARPERSEARARDRGA
jgi:hypothetical protein